MAPILLALLLLIGCEDRQQEGIRGEILYHGESAIYASPTSRRIVALFTDEGVYRAYYNEDQVGRASDIGDRIFPCESGIEECIQVAGIYLMSPPSNEAAWEYDGYRFVGESSEDAGGEIIVVASRQGREEYSYGYHDGCGIRWINFSAGRQQGQEVFYAVGRPLFFRNSCD